MADAPGLGPGPFGGGGSNPLARTDVPFHFPFPLYTCSFLLPFLILSLPPLLSLTFSFHPRYRSCYPSRSRTPSPPLGSLPRARGPPRSAHDPVPPRRGTGPLRVAPRSTGPSSGAASSSPTPEAPRPPARFESRAQRDLAGRHDPLVPRDGTGGWSRSSLVATLPCGGGRGGLGGDRGRRVAAFYQVPPARVPASMLTDNGCIFTAQFRNRRCGFETELPLGIHQRGKPYHPRPRERSSASTDLQALVAQTDRALHRRAPGQVDFFVRYYNETTPLARAWSRPRPTTP